MHFHYEYEFLSLLQYSLRIINLPFPLYIKYKPLEPNASFLSVL